MGKQAVVLRCIRRNIYSFRDKISYDFFTPSEKADVVLSVEGKDFYVSKQVRIRVAWMENPPLNFAHYIANLTGERAQTMKKRIFCILTTLFVRIQILISINCDF